MKWKPNVGEKFHYVEFDKDEDCFVTKSYIHDSQSDIEEDDVIKKGWCFQSSFDACDFALRLNLAISNVPLYR